MHGEDNRRGFVNNGYRRQQFHDRNPNYSPSTSYNYNPQGTGGNYAHQHNSQHPRRRTDRFRREVFSANERLVKQNSQIIQLLQEISNKLSVIGGLGQASGVASSEPQPAVVTGQETYCDDMADSIDELNAQHDVASAERVEEEDPTQMEDMSREETSPQ